MTHPVKWTDDEIIARIREFAQANELPPPAPAEAADELEACLGHPMPTLLRRIYCEVANGGFGVDGEVVALVDTGGPWYSDEESLADICLRGPNGPEEQAIDPPHVMPLVTLGCAIWWFVDLRSPHGRMWGWDPIVTCPHPGGSGSVGVLREAGRRRAFAPSPAWE
ncbi:hypothetical protein [Peterkaempfera griseoplana]|uniref:hypothetical protein n=1 Tax=Peterkaempfera griseoplana TaxID=66896 RepID=UPI0012FEA44E|nr:hypothetical protein [Peterkaempfera griseoplana]